MLRAGLCSIDNDKKWIGGRYYLHHLVKAVAQAGSEHDIELREVRWQRESAADAFDEVRRLIGEPIIVAPPTSWPRRIARKIKRLGSPHLDARDLFKAQGVDVLFPIPPCDNAGTPYVFWLPDFQYARRPDLVSEQLRAHQESYFRFHVERASQIVLSSEDARNDFAAIYPAHLARTHVVRFCSVPDEAWWASDPAATAKAYDLPDRFLIVCNQFTRHKNHVTLMKAMKILVDRGMDDIHLVCTGSTFDHRNEDYAGQMQRLIAGAGLEKRVHILGLIPRCDQIALLRQAVAILQPSSFEGWSTIIEDAKSLGKTLLVSDLPVHREQLGIAHRYLGVESASDWADTMASTWAERQGGPSARDEANGALHLQQAVRECASAFSRALHAA
ncbi:glycosyltransferase family 4 protein [Caenimonas koreensis]|uniref:glycosyltransferase family 4 protein n=1 Tax=Caenimonas koreensis TaxID=367474 RepID=UPI003782F34F